MLTENARRLAEAMPTDASFTIRVGPLDVELLLHQYDWLMSQPQTDERDGLAKLLAHMLEWAPDNMSDATRKALKEERDGIVSVIPALRTGEVGRRLQTVEELLDEDGIEDRRRAQQALDNLMARESR